MRYGVVSTNLNQVRDDRWEPSGTVHAVLLGHLVTTMCGLPAASLAGQFYRHDFTTVDVYRCPVCVTAAGWR